MVCMFLLCSDDDVRCVVYEFRPSESMTCSLHGPDMPHRCHAFVPDVWL